MINQVVHAGNIMIWRKEFCDKFSTWDSKVLTILEVAHLKEWIHSTIVKSYEQLRSKIRSWRTRLAVESCIYTRIYGTIKVTYIYTRISGTIKVTYIYTRISGTIKVTYIYTRISGTINVTYIYTRISGTIKVTYIYTRISGTIKVTYIYTRISGTLKVVSTHGYPAQ
jgi:hypothetical protein